MLKESCRKRLCYRCCRHLRSVRRHPAWPTQTRQARSQFRRSSKTNRSSTSRVARQFLSLLPAFLLTSLRLAQFPNSTRWVGRLLSLARIFMTAAIAGPSTNVANLPKLSMTKAPARAGACTSWAAKGPTTYNACATLKWNQGTSFPIQSGHGCIGCSEPEFLGQGRFLRCALGRQLGQSRCPARRSSCRRSPRCRLSNCGSRSQEKGAGG